MSDAKITLSEYGTDLSSRATGVAVRRLLVATLGQDRRQVVVDFANVRTVSESFADEVFGILVAENGKAWFKEHVSLVRLSGSARNAILRAVSERLNAVSDA